MIHKGLSSSGPVGHRRASDLKKHQKLTAMAEAICATYPAVYRRFQSATHEIVCPLMQQCGFDDQGASNIPVPGFQGVLPRPRTPSFIQTDEVDSSCIDPRISTMQEQRME